MNNNPGPRTFDQAGIEQMAEELLEVMRQQVFIHHRKFLLLPYETIKPHIESLYRTRFPEKSLPDAPTPFSSQQKRPSRVTTFNTFRHNINNAWQSLEADNLILRQSNSPLGFNYLACCAKEEDIAAFNLRVIKTLKKKEDIIRRKQAIKALIKQDAQMKDILRDKSSAEYKVNTTKSHINKIEAKIKSRIQQIAQEMDYTNYTTLLRTLKKAQSNFQPNGIDDVNSTFLGANLVHSKYMQPSLTYHDALALSAKNIEGLDDTIKDELNKISKNLLEMTPTLAAVIKRVEKIANNIYEAAERVTIDPPLNDLKAELAEEQLNLLECKAKVKELTHQYGERYSQLFPGVKELLENQAALDL